MITIAIPHKGRGLEQVLDRFVNIGTLPKVDKEYICEVVSLDKERITEERKQIQDGSRTDYSSISLVDAALQAKQQNNETAHSLLVDYDFHRAGQPARVLFRGLDTNFEGIPIRVIGKSHFDIPTALRNHIAAIGFVGWDELYADHIDHLTERDIRDWNALNSYLRDCSTDVRIKGSAGLRDYTGHFLMVDKSIAERIDSIGDFTSHNGFIPAVYDENLEQIGWEKSWMSNPVFVDHKYQVLYESLLKDSWWSSHFVGSNDVENDVTKNKGIGIYVVQSGSTAKRKNIHLVGSPLLISETIIAANEEELQRNPDIEKVVESFEPLKQTSPLSASTFYVWHRNLHETLGDNYKFVREAFLFPGNSPLNYFPGYHKQLV